MLKKKSKIKKKKSKKKVKKRKKKKKAKKKKRVKTKAIKIKERRIEKKEELPISSKESSEKVDEKEQDIFGDETGSEEDFGDWGYEEDEELM